MTSGSTAAHKALLVADDGPGAGELAKIMREALPEASVARATAMSSEVEEGLGTLIVDARTGVANVRELIERARTAQPGIAMVAVIARGEGGPELLAAGVDELCEARVDSVREAVSRAHIRRRAACQLDRRIQAEHESHRQARLSRHNEALRALTRQLSSDDLHDQLGAITEAAADTLEVARASIWLLDAEHRQLRAVDTFDRVQGQHSEGGVLLAKDHGEYFRALEGERSIVADDAREHPWSRSLAASYLEPHGVGALLAAPIRVGTRFLGVLCHEHVGGSRVFTDEDANVAGSLGDFAALAIESHEHRRAEDALRTSNLKLDEARRIEAVGRLAGGVAHDFNNVITVVSSYAFLLAKKLDREDPLQAPVAEIAKAAERAADITRKLLALSRREPAPPRVFDLNHTVRGMESFLRRMIGEHIVLKLDLADRPLLLHTDPGLVEQVILNLVVNARDAARPEGSTITIRSTFDASTKKKAERPCVLEVADTGVGMTPEVQARIFEPFFTTKEVGQGSGLGLFTVWGAVTQMNGTVEVKSTENRGTRFTLRFVESVPESDGPHEVLDRKHLLGTETILLVEDEAQVRDVTALLLRELGYKVLEAANIDQALAHARHTRDIQLLVSDIVMPKASGTVVAARIKELVPALHVLFISGYNKEMLSAYDASLGPTLPKPFTAEQLGRKVRELLDS